MKKNILLVAVIACTLQISVQSSPAQPAPNAAPVNGSPSSTAMPMSGGLQSMQGMGASDQMAKKSFFSMPGRGYAQKSTTEQIATNYGQNINYKVIPQRPLLTLVSTKNYNDLNEWMNFMMTVVNHSRINPTIDDQYLTMSKCQMSYSSFFANPKNIYSAIDTCDLNYVQGYLQAALKKTNPSAPEFNRNTLAKRIVDAYNNRAQQRNARIQAQNAKTKQSAEMKAAQANYQYTPAQSSIPPMPQYNQQNSMPQPQAPQAPNPIASQQMPPPSPQGLPSYGSQSQQPSYQQASTQSSYAPQMQQFQPSAPEAPTGFASQSQNSYQQASAQPSYAPQMQQFQPSAPEAPTGFASQSQNSYQQAGTQPSYAPQMQQTQPPAPSYNGGYAQNPSNNMWNQQGPAQQQFGGMNRSNGFAPQMGNFSNPMMGNSQGQFGNSMMNSPFSMNRGPAMDAFGQQPNQFDQFGGGQDPSMGMFGQQQDPFNQFGGGMDPSMGMFGQQQDPFNQFGGGMDPSMGMFGQQQDPFNQFGGGMDPSMGMFGQQQDPFNQFGGGMDPSMGMFGQQPNQFNQFGSGLNPPMNGMMPNNFRF